ncbi:Gfo/Idh/MocA family protein [Kineococcus sp. SYSU DK003]|uniref:Gfo/Idh/MocA family protein n=1 Tax=Kineococcus sp. SYSU DK003 TaxID=3383124 RepID=UPI003D7C835B
MSTPRVALVGVHGYGARHLEVLLPRHRDGALDLVGVADPRIDEPGTGPLPASTARHADLGALLSAQEPDVVVVSTPLHTHAALAQDAMRAGAHVLVEKPPTSDLPSFEALLRTATETGRSCQVGFQSLGSAAVTHVRARVAEGRIGEVTGYSAAGCWVRPRSYYRRTPWAGHRVLDGHVVGDGVLTNPLSHAVATVLALAGARRVEDVAEVQCDLFHVNDIEADDTSTARIRLVAGPDVLAAVTLAAAERGEPWVRVEGSQGRITLYYTLDVAVEERPGRPPLVTRHTRVNLLDDLLAAVSEGRPPVSALEDSGGFVRVLDAVVTGTPPRAVDGRWTRTVGLADGDERVELPGVEEAVHLAVERRALFSELSLPWTARPADRVAGPR